MAKIDLEEFLEKNKSALIQEAGKSFNSLIENISDVINEETTGDAHKDLDRVRQDLMAISLNAGFLGAVLNQLFILLTGAVPEDEEETPMGFSALLQEGKTVKKKHKKEKDEED